MLYYFKYLYIQNLYLRNNNFYKILNIKDNKLINIDNKLINKNIDKNIDIDLFKLLLNNYLI